MKKTIFIILIICLTLSLISCKSQNEKETEYIDNAIEKIKTAKGYETEVNVYVYDINGVVENYTSIQYYKAPNKYKIITLFPEELKGKITYYIEGKMFVSTNDFIRSYDISSGKDIITEKLFLSQYASNYLINDTSKYQVMYENNKPIVKLTYSTDNNNDYFHTENLYIECENYTPIKLEVLSIDDNLTMEIIYKNFEFKDNINDDIFKVNAK